MKQINKAHVQLMARCLFAFGKVHYENYAQYYKDVDFSHKPKKLFLDIVAN